MEIKNSSSAPPVRSIRPLGGVLWPVAVFCATLIAYLPAITGGFIWNDSDYVTKPALQSLAGLKRIVFEIGATEQYYPVLHGAFWVEHRLWGDSPVGYHLLNVLLHATAAVLFGLVLQRLWTGDEASSLVSREERGWKPRHRISAPMFAAFVFALHPVCVESVAWISEQKNTLSAVFYLLAMLAYLKYDQFLQEGRKDREENLPSHFNREIGKIGKEDIGAKAELSTGDSLLRDLCDLPVKSSPARERRDLQRIPLLPERATIAPSRSPCKKWYFVSFLLFVLALLSKSVTATFPAAILVILWWKRGTLSWRRDVMPLLPFFAIGAAWGLVSAWVEHTYVGAQGAAFDLSAVQRILLAGHIAWFYLAKDIWPAGLIFIYPRWRVNAADPALYAWLAALLALVAVCWLVRKRTRGPLAAILFFLGTLFPVSGLFNVYGFVFSYVADHWQYMSLLGTISFAACGWSLLEARLARPGVSASFRLPTSVFRLSVFPWLIICLFGVLTFRQCGLYRNIKTFYSRTLEKNPEAWMMHTNLAIILAAEGRTAEAIGHYRQALQGGTYHPEVIHNDLGALLLGQGKLPQATAEFESALRLAPGYEQSRRNLGIVLLDQRRYAEARTQFESALRSDPKDAVARNDLGIALIQAGHRSEGLAQFEAAAEIAPGYVRARINLGSALALDGRYAEAAEQFGAALRLDPDNPEAHFDLGMALARQDRTAEAKAEFEEALRLKPDYAAARERLDEIGTH